MIFYILTNVAQAGNSFWLSFWSNRANLELECNELNFTNCTSTKYLDLGIYTGIGIFQCDKKLIFF